MRELNLASFAATCRTTRDVVGTLLRHHRHGCSPRDFATASSTTSTPPGSRQQRQEQQPMLQRSLSPLDVKGTLSLLNPDVWHLSPCWGAAMSSSPVVRNLLQLNKSFLNKKIDGKNKSEHHTSRAEQADISSSNLAQVGQLASLLFFQGRDRYHPIRPIRTKSMAAAYLTAERIGMIVGLTNFHNDVSKLDDNVMKEQLQRVGINKSNHVDGKWTGVSLARWKELIQLSSKPPCGYNHDHYLTRSMWLYFLWSTVRSKEELLDYMLMLDKYYVSSSMASNDDLKGSIFNPGSEQAQALRFDPVAREEWCKDSFRPEDLIKNENYNNNNNNNNNDVDLSHIETDGGDLHSTRMFEYVNQFMDQLLATDGTGNYSKSSGAEAALQLELLCARWAMRYSTHKPTIRNSKYSFDDGEIKPDCVEVTVREVMDLLVWDGWTWNTNRVPNTTHPDLIRIYKTQQNQMKDNVIQSSPSTPTTETSLSGIEDIGQAWFNLLSDIPTCSYLSQSPGGKKYELTPTLANVAEAARFLLHSNDNDQQSSHWTSMEDVANFWNSNYKRNLPYSNNTWNLVVSSRIHSFRQALGDETVHHEIATMSIVDATTVDVDGATDTTQASVELRLDKAHGTSAVTHLHNNGHATDQHQTEDLMNFYDKCKTLINLPDKDGKDPSHLWADNCSLALAMELVDDNHMPLPSDELHTYVMKHALSDFLLSTRYGADRRLLTPSMESTDLARRQQAYRKAYDTSCDVLLNAIKLVCLNYPNGTLLQDNDQLVLLLSWLLQEDPTIVDNNNYDGDDQPTTSASQDISTTAVNTNNQEYYWNQVEQVLVQELPTTLLVDEVIRSAIRYGGGERRGELTLRLLDVQKGGMSQQERFEGLTYLESFHLMRKMLSFRS